MRRPKVLLLLIGAVLLLGTGVAVAMFSGPEDEEFRAVYELDTSSETEDDEASTTSEEETTSEAKKTKKTQAEKDVAKAERKKNRARKGGKAGGGVPRGQGSGGYSYGAAPANVATPTGGSPSSAPVPGETTTSNPTSEPETENALTGQDPSSVPGPGETEGGTTQPGDFPPGEGDTTPEPDTEGPFIVQYSTPGQEQEAPEGSAQDTAAPKGSVRRP